MEAPGWPSAHPARNESEKVSADRGARSSAWVEVGVDEREREPVARSLHSKDSSSTEANSLSGEADRKTHHTLPMSLDCTWLTSKMSTRNSITRSGWHSSTPIRWPSKAPASVTSLLHVCAASPRDNADHTSDHESPAATDGVEGWMSSAPPQPSAELRDCRGGLRAASDDPYGSLRKFARQEWHETHDLGWASAQAARTQTLCCASIPRSEYWHGVRACACACVVSLLA